MTKVPRPKSVINTFKEFVDAPLNLIFLLSLFLVPLVSLRAVEAQEIKPTQTPLLWRIEECHPTFLAPFTFLIPG